MSKTDGFAELTGNIFLQVDATGKIHKISANSQSELGLTERHLSLTLPQLFDAESWAAWAGQTELALNAQQIHERAVTLKHPTLGDVRYRAKTKYSAEAKTFLVVLSRLSEAEEKLPLVLQKTLDQLNISLKTANMGVWEMQLKPDGGAIDSLSWDLEMCRMHGVPPGTAVNTAEWFYTHVHPEDVLHMSQQHRQNLERGRNEMLSLTYRMIWPNSEIHFIEAYGVLSRADNNPQALKMYGVAKDVTQDVLKRKLLEDQKNSILTNSRMTVLGEVSGGIAHEINNPLTVIQARSFQLLQMIEQNNLDPVKVRAIAESISKTGDKIAKIIKSIRAFAQSQENTPFDLVSIEELIDETLEFCKVRFYNHGIQIQVAPLPENLEIECRLVQIEEVLLSLFNNAYDAILKLQEKWITIEAFDKGSEVEIHITDSGGGIPEAIADQMMLPFYTTKDSGNGTGLGLSIAAEIVHNHHGEIKLDRTSAHTRFILSFPKRQPMETAAVSERQ